MRKRVRVGGGTRMRVLGISQRQICRVQVC